MIRSLILGILALAALAAEAREVITIYYAWGPGDSVANYHRTLAAEANKIQDRYTFVFDTKPGAGGALAANHVLNTPNAVLAHSTAFFIRPVVYPNESYDLTKFREQYVHCMAPMAVTSSKYKTWRDVPTNQPLTVGTSGLGVTTHLAAIQLQKRFPQMTIVPHKSTTDSMISMVSGNTDFHIGFISEAEQWLKENTKSPRKVTVLGITGTKIVNGYQPLAQQGFDRSFADMNVGHHLLNPVAFSQEKSREFHDIFARAAQTPSVRAAYAIDYCEPQTVKFEDLGKFYIFHTNYWRTLSQGIKIQ